MSKDAVCAVAVTYHPDPEFADRIDRVMPQVGGIVIVDNGSSDLETDLLHQIAKNPAIALKLNRSNLGIASALNIGIRHAIARGFAWVLLLDQDSCVFENMVAELLAAHNSYPFQEKLAVVGAGFRDINKDVRDSKDVRDNKDESTVGHYPAESLWEETHHVITSGSLIPLSAYAIVGPFREEFFIDRVDLEFCFRARAMGYRIIKTRKPLMTHAIGAYTQHRVLWKKKWTTNHSAERRYYIARNDTVMLREYGDYPLGLWRLKSLQRCLRLWKRIALYENSKVDKMAAVAQGWWDGIHGTMGPRHRSGAS